ncbi:hypothetical protein G7046_g7487 [Stylonectria norvegica]|nr:hypothetical protein G7046_g7487 [Stylonectria norvegica]
MVRHNTLFQLALCLILHLPWAQGALSPPHGGGLAEPRDFRLSEATVATLLGKRHLDEGLEGKPHLVQALSLVKRLVEDHGTMAQVPEEDLLELLDRINRLQEQVSGMLPSGATSKQPEAASETRSQEQPQNQQTSAPENQVKNQKLANDTPTDPNGDPSNSQTDGQTTGSPGEVFKETAIDSAEGPSATSSEISQEQSEKSPNKGLGETSTGDLVPDQTQNLPGGRFKEGQAQNNEPSETSTETATAADSQALSTTTTVEPASTLTETATEAQLAESGISTGFSEQQSGTQSKEPTAVESLCLADPNAIGGGSGDKVSGNSPLRQGTNCTLNTASVGNKLALDSTRTTRTTKTTTIASTIILQSTITALYPYPNGTQQAFGVKTPVANIASIQTTPTPIRSTSLDAVSSSVVSVHEGPISADQRLRTLVFTSTIKKNSTMTVTSIHTVLFPVAQASGSANGTVFLEEDDEGNVQDDDGDEDVTASNSSLAVDSEVSVAYTTATPISVKNNLASITSIINTPISSGTLDTSTAAQASSQGSLQSPRTAPKNITPIITRLSSFKTVAKPTTSISEGTF